MVAIVLCKCFEEGRTTEPPVPRSLILLDAAGDYDLSLPFEGNQDLYFAFVRWRENCCPHQDMYFAHVDEEADWDGYQHFMQAFGRLGWEHFPTLRAGVPKGGMPPASAAKALAELHYFREHVSRIDSVFLIDSETNEEVREYVAGSSGEFLWCGSPGFAIGLDEQGFFIRDLNVEPPREVFRSWRFRQCLLDSLPPEPRQRYGGSVAYVDIDNGQRFRCTCAIAKEQWEGGSQYRWEYPRHMHVARRAYGIADFAYVLEPLTTIFEASVAIGNPVRWY